MVRAKMLVLDGQARLKAALEFSSPSAADGPCLQYLETGRRRRDVPGRLNDRNVAETVSSKVGLERLHPLHCCRSSPLVEHQQRVGVGRAVVRIEGQRFDRHLLFACAGTEFNLCVAQVLPAA